MWVTFEFLLISVRYVSYYELVSHTITPDSLGGLYITVAFWKTTLLLKHVG